MDGPTQIKPMLSPDEQGELASIAYLLANLESMRSRDLISSEAYETVVAETLARRAEIERGGRFLAALTTARSLATTDPVRALTWATEARGLAPERPEGWSAELDLLSRLRRESDALALCSEAAQRFPELSPRLKELSRAGENSVASPTDLVVVAEDPNDPLPMVKEAVKAGDDQTVISLCSPWLARQPNHPDPLIHLAFALRRVGRLDEALALYRRLCQVQPENRVWPQWVRSLELEIPRSSARAVRTPLSPGVERTFATAPMPAPAPEPEPGPARRGFSWSSVAGEFLEEHWQKLILCLAVLLIVVSSTVGAHLLLGPRLWSPVGKCALALVYTVMFATFGTGLVRWGAERAGRMMLLTTLIVVPVNFMLAGEMRLLIDPTPSRLVVLGLDVAALFLVTRVVAGALGWRSGSSFLAVALVALSACDAATARGISFAWGFSAFLIPPWLFVGAVWWLNTRYRAESDEEQREFSYSALGLLAFALLSGLLRTAAVMKGALNPCLFAVPIMLTAIASVLTAHHLARFEKDQRRILLMRFGGLILSALAFALALSRPPGPFPLYSGNTMATALLGLVLYAGALAAYRHPAYLYCGFGALFLGYFGAFYFVVDLVHSVEELARQALGYRAKLPFPFKALNGLAFNLVLGGLALVFSRRWNDQRLARHCHYLGVPLSIAACLLSALETKAAVLCMSGYTILYAVGIPLFSEPRIVYLASAALSGALLFGSMLWPGVTLGARALGAVTLGSLMALVGGWVRNSRISDAYRVPLIHVTLVLSVAGMTAAASSILPPMVATREAMSAFALAAGLCMLVLGDLPHRAIVHLITAGLLGALLGIVSIASGSSIGLAPRYGVATAALGLGLLSAVEWLLQRTSIRSRLFTAEGPDGVPVLVLLAVAMAAGVSRATAVPAAMALALGGASLLWLTRFRRESLVVHLGIVLVVASQLVLGWGRVPWTDPGIGLGALALIAAVSALVLWRTGYVLRREGGADFYAIPCFRIALGLTFVIFGLALNARLLSRDSFPAGAVALLANGLVYALLTTAWRSPGLTYAAVGSLVSATYLTLFSVGQADPSKAYVLGLVAVVEALAFWTLGLVSLQGGRDDRGRVYGRPLFVSSLLLTLLAIPTSLSSPGSMVLIAVSFLLMIKCFPAAGWIYAVLGTLGWVFHLTLLPHLSNEQLIIGTVLGTFGLWGLGAVTRRVGPRLCRRLVIPPLALSVPVFNVAVLLGYLALVLVIMPVVSGGAAWSDHAWVPLSLSLFCLLMVEAHADRGWVHAFALLATLGCFMALGPWVSTPSDWLLSGMVLAFFWLVLGRDFLSVEPWLCRRFSIEEVGAGGVLESWSFFLGSVAGGLSGLLILVATLDSIYFGDVPSSLIAEAGWRSVGLALGLAWFYVLAQAFRFGDYREVGHTAILTLLLWWVGLSPFLERHGWGPAVLSPPLTAALGLAVAMISRRDEVGVVISAHRFELSVRASFVLGLIGCGFAVMAPRSNPAIVTLGLATATFAFLAVVRHRTASAYALGLSWCSLCALLVDRLGRPWLIARETPYEFDFALGVTVAVFALWGLSGWLSRTEFGKKSWGATGRGRVVRGLERMALLGAFFAMVAVATLAMSLGARQLGDFEALASVGILLALAGFTILAARRWQVEWLVYVAQATLLGAYFDYRHYFPVAVGTDAAVLTLFGYLDLGLSEVMQRLRMNLYARPTLYVSLVLPLIPPAMVLLDGRFDDLSLFLLLSTAAFYGVACYTKQWKSLGYAAAVLLNATLWVAWSRVGWHLTDHPQLFLIPVGLSTILFAEVNRREFGNDVVNAIRGVGLTLVYASLALPIWQFESFGAWLTLLLFSLVGILVGIGLRIQTFLWLGLVGFILDVVYQVGRVSSENALARWGVMLSLGILLILFVAFNEKKRIVATMRQYYDQARQWE